MLRGLVRVCGGNYMRNLTLTIQSWAAWVPGYDQCLDWLSWSPSLAQEHACDMPDLSFIKPMVRRRLSTNSRIAMRVAHDSLGIEHIDSAVFCSRHGECKRTLGIYTSIAKSDAVSPTQFSQSVHNVGASIFSIEKGLPIPVTAVAAGQASLENGFVEAWSQLACGAQSVLLVMSDERLDEPFTQFTTIPQFSFGLALRVAREGQGQQLTLLQDTAGGEKADSVTGGTDNLLAMLTGHAELGLVGNNGWHWRVEG